MRILAAQPESMLLLGDSMVGALTLEPMGGTGKGWYILVCNFFNIKGIPIYLASKMYYRMHRRALIHHIVCKNNYKPIKGGQS